MIHEKMQSIGRKLENLLSHSHSPHDAFNILFLLAKSPEEMVIIEVLRETWTESQRTLRRRTPHQRRA